MEKLNSNKSRILLLTTYYPPVQSVATNRMFAFSKYLTEQGFEVDVISISNDKESAISSSDNIHVTRIYEGFPFLPLKFEKKTSVIKHKLKSAINLVLPYISNMYFRWERDAFIMSCKQHEDKCYDIVVSSFSPENPHKVALKLKAKYPDIKWIADMRDEFSINSGLSGAALKKRCELERDILNNCDLLTSVSVPILKLFKNSKPDLNSKLILNGFDFEVQDPCLNVQHSKLIIGYAGSFYGNRNPDNFLQAVSELVKLDNDLFTSISIKFMGVSKNVSIPDNLLSIVEFYPKGSYLESIDFIRSCDVGLLVLPVTGLKGIYTGKIFDYLGALTCILGVVDRNDVAAELIEKLECGYVANSNNVNEIKAAILEMLEDWKINSLKRPNYEDVVRFHRRESVYELGNMCRDLLL